MRKKYGKLQTKENIIVFPGMVDRLITEGLKHAEDFQYDLAVDSLRQALTFTEPNEQALGIYAYSLYEIGEFEEARTICEELLKVGPTYYFETMELYVTVLIELRQFSEVTQIVESLLEENVIPLDKVDKFEQLLNLNMRVGKEIGETPLEDVPHNNQIDSTLFQYETFLRFSEDKQQQLLVELEGEDLAPIEQELATIIEGELTSPITKSFALLLMAHEGIKRTVTIDKFGHCADVVPKGLPDPSETKGVESVLKLTGDQLLQNPTKLEMVHDLIIRQSFATYPFEWFSFEEQEVAEAYIKYVGEMLGEDVKCEGKLYELFMKIDMIFEQRSI
ncbi:hypothetical protein [Paenisporosarcina sp. TG20]|uniref:tetratricopeptide repeat protein n=1 Tax=Paenisporosarcina sp. TG20 TaxID=1211706 RepID=UPI00030FAA93|nr:hypothetical protein [Paenisporosarcina sp. TG20]